MFSLLVVLSFFARLDVDSKVKEEERLTLLELERESLDKSRISTVLALETVVRTLGAVLPNPGVENVGSLEVDDPPTIDN